MKKYNVFAYGELMKKERLLELINRIPNMIKGRVYNYEKFFDKTIGYYGAKKKEGSYIDGIILLGITDKELEVFDEYEDLDVYYIREKTIAVGENGKEYNVYIYLRKY
ncbi:gamma-glutamylcyclotransferase family protein [Methanocaldococcus fervens]|uniref:Putative gamma-glutamylcyclotransferase n=1 Tax=Methanocaldococcus fervens (strain DSM 4213 / JCM 15782 / AG86) TaxID=573064 RepID=C7P8B5_METFA|nr:gamma-glutamylcyclotransferase family protein [Methanocaldococcus fervens]ACV24797.1 AIG2 family protein [Methanocaldococcus fervens AG86]